MFKSLIGEYHLPDNLVSILSRYSLPTVISTIIGGAVWMTTLYSNVKENTEDLSELKTTARVEIKEVKRENRDTRQKIFMRLNKQEERLSRIEGKLDIMIDAMQRKP